MENIMARFDGYLFSKLYAIGTKSEGPIYILQRWDYSEHMVIKKTLPWEKDPDLHKFLDQKVTIEGVFGQDGIRYEKISALPSEKGLDLAETHKLEVSLKLEHDILWVNKMPPQPKPQSMNLILSVRWPYRSIWHGVCPTSQLYDFFVETHGKMIWQWSKGRSFSMIVTPVNVSGGDPVEYSIAWRFSSDEILDGDYQARAVFIASGQEAVKSFKVSSAY